MPRAVIATLTVDRPWFGIRAENTAKWLQEHADLIEGNGANYNDTGPFIGRRIIPDYTGVNGEGQTVAKLRIEVPGALSVETRARIAKWIRSRAQYLLKHNATAMTSRRGWFKQEFSL